MKTKERLWKEIMFGDFLKEVPKDHTTDSALKAMSTYANQILDEVLNTCFEDLGEGIKHFNKHKLAEIRKKI